MKESKWVEELIYIQNKISTKCFSEDGHIRLQFEFKCGMTSNFFDIYLRYDRTYENQIALHFSYFGKSLWIKFRKGNKKGFIKKRNKFLNFIARKMYYDDSLKIIKEMENEL